MPLSDTAWYLAVVVDARQEQSKTGDVVRRLQPTTESYELFAQRLRDDPPDTWRFLCRAPSPDAAKSLAYRIRKGRSAGFRPAGHYDASSEGCEVVVSYVGDPNSNRAAETHELRAEAERRARAAAEHAARAALRSPTHSPR